MKCLDPVECRCLCHVDVRTHIPVCPDCYAPLTQYTRRPGRWDRPGDPLAEPESGKCVIVGCPARDRRVRPDEFLWRDRNDYAVDDCPPFNGLLPIELGALQ